ncbi:MAG: peptidyl-prolyl cis-trans isomerase, partial [Candidatus Marinimicrobia bacterium]|nr:peptidyl-prolyl cis-trans isomerase [Candidatus Neomarinimicrobiota bacterium]
IQIPEEASFSFPIGEISDIVETRYGFHILKVIDRKKETRPLEKVRPQLEAQISIKKKNEATPIFLENLKEKTEFEVIEF